MRNFLNTRYISREVIPYFKSYWPKNFSLHSDQQLHKIIHETNEGMLCLKSQLSFWKQTIENIVQTDVHLYYWKWTWKWSYIIKYKLYGSYKQKVYQKFVFNKLVVTLTLIQTRHSIYLVKSSYLQIPCQFPCNPFSECGLFILNIRKNERVVTFFEKWRIQ